MVRSITYEEWDDEMLEKKAWHEPKIIDTIDNVLEDEWKVMKKALESYRELKRKGEHV